MAFQSSNKDPNLLKLLKLLSLGIVGVVVIVSVIWFVLRAQYTTEFATIISLLVGILGLFVNFVSMVFTVFNSQQVRSGFTGLGTFLKSLFSNGWTWVAIPSGALIVILMLYVILPFVWYLLQPVLPIPLIGSCTLPQTASFPSTYIGVTQEPDGQKVGISVGGTDFDTQRAQDDVQAKEAAAQAFGKNDISGAEQEWLIAHGADSSDAEPAIYQEDQQVLETGIPYIDIIVGVTFKQAFIGGSRDTLQGAYAAQLAFNQSHTSIRVRLLIANSGDGYATQVSCQSIRAIQADHRIVGIMGWPLSGDTHSSVDMFNKAHIPMISATASSDLLHGFPYFSRVSPPDTFQGQDAADYAKQSKLHATKVALFWDPKNEYSASLATAFSREFTQNAGHRIVASEIYTVGKPQNLPNLLQDALKAGPDLLFFSGYAGDVSVLLDRLPNCSSSPSSCLPVMGGDGLYIYGDYTSSHPIFNQSNLYFTSFGFPDEWQWFHLSPPPFFNDYAMTFGPEPDGKGPYGYTRPDAVVMLSFDAVSFMLAGCDHLSKQIKEITSQNLQQEITPQNLQQELRDFTGSQAFQGVTGQISSGPDGNPMNKEILMLHVENGLTHIEQAWGCLLKNACPR